MDQKTIDRINELARKAKTEGLTPEEKEEQSACEQKTDCPCCSHQCARQHVLRGCYRKGKIQIAAVTQHLIKPYYAEQTAHKENSYKTKE